MQTHRLVGFVKDCKGFGEYVPWPDDHVFAVGECIWVYVELRNVANKKERGPDGRDVYTIELTPHLAARTYTALENMSWVTRDVIGVLKGDAPRFPAPGAPLTRA